MRFVQFLFFKHTLVQNMENGIDNSSEDMLFSSLV